MAYAAMGTRLLIGANSVAELKEIGGLEISSDTIETTTMDSNGWRQFIGGMKDAGEVSLSGFFNPADTNGQNALYSALTNGTVLNFSIVFPSTLNASWTFSGVVTKYTTSSAMEDAVTFEATVKVSGTPNLGLTASTGLSALALSGTAGTLSPGFGVSNYNYTYSFTGGNLTVTATAASHTIQLYIDGVFSQTLTSGSASSTITFVAANTIKKLTIVAYESGKTQKIYDIMALRTS